MAARIKAMETFSNPDDRGRGRGRCHAVASGEGLPYLVITPVIQPGLVGTVERRPRVGLS